MRIKNRPEALTAVAMRVRRGSRKSRFTVVASAGSEINSAPSAAARVTSVSPLLEATQCG